MAQRRYMFKDFFPIVQAHVASPSCLRQPIDDFDGVIMNQNMKSPLFKCLQLFSPKFVLYFSFFQAYQGQPK